MASGRIRFTADDEKLLRKTVRNFNDKINRVLKKDPSAIVYLPGKKSLAEERKKVLEGTRKEFQIETKVLKKFSEKGAEKEFTNQLGLRVTQWEVGRVKELVRRENIGRAQRRKKISTDVKAGLATEEEKALQKKKEFDVQTKTPKEFQKMAEIYEKRQTSKFKAEGFETFKKNYIKSITANLGPFGRKILEHVRKMSAKTLYETVKNDPDLGIDFMYGNEAAADKAERMMEKLGLEDDFSDMEFDMSEEE